MIPIPAHFFIQQVNSALHIRELCGSYYLIIHFLPINPVFSSHTVLLPVLTVVITTLFLLNGLFNGLLVNCSENG